MAARLVATSNVWATAQAAGRWLTAAHPTWLLYERHFLDLSAAQLEVRLLLQTCNPQFIKPDSIYPHLEQQSAMSSLKYFALRKQTLFEKPLVDQLIKNSGNKWIITAPTRPRH